MSKKNLLSGRDRELYEMAELYESAKAEGRSIYLDADDWADLADWYSMRHRSQLAAEVVEYGLRLHADNTALLVEKAYLLLDKRETEEAKAVAENIIEDSPEVTILRACLLMEEQKDKEAAVLLETLDKEDVANIVDVAYMYIDMGLPETAMSWIALGNDRYENKESFLAVKGDCYYALGRQEEAVKIFNELIDRNPYSAPYWLALARSYFDMQQFDKSIDACDYAIIADDEFADAYIMKGHAFFQLGNEEQAIENYIKAEKLNAVSPGFIHAVVGMHLTDKKQWEEAYGHLEKAIESEVWNDENIALSAIYANAALCLHRMGKSRKAHQYCKKSLGCNPDDPETYLIEGRIYMEEGKYDKSIRSWGKALECAPYADTWYEIGIRSMEAGLMEYARIAFERVKELNPDFEKINEKLTSVYMMMKDKENFKKYNQLCQHPLQVEELEQALHMLEEGNETRMAEVLRQILDALK